MHLFSLEYLFRFATTTGVPHWWPRAKAPIPSEKTEESQVKAGLVVVIGSGMMVFCAEAMKAEKKSITTSMNIRKQGSRII